MKFFKALRRWIRGHVEARIWAHKHRELNREFNIVVDTCTLLSGEERAILRYFKVWLPYAVWQEIRRQARVIASGGAEEVEVDENSTTPKRDLSVSDRKKEATAKITAPLMRKLVIKGKWSIFGSAGTGMVGKLMRVCISNLDTYCKTELDYLYRWRRKELDWNWNLEDLVGTSDIRVLATALQLMNEGIPNVVLLTKDKTLTLVAKSYDIRVEDKVSEISKIAQP